MESKTEVKPAVVEIRVTIKTTAKKAKPK